MLAFAGTLIVISLLTFGSTSLRSPTDIARSALGRDRTPAQLQAFAHQRGLDDPLPVRYIRWLDQFVTGNWGNSVITDQPIRPDLGIRLQRSLTLAAAALLIAVPIGIQLGMSQGRRRGSAFDLGANTTAVAVAALPEFVVAIVLLWVLAIQVPVLPVDSSGLLFGGIVEGLQAYALPVLTLAIILMPQITRMTRAAAIDVMSTPYIRSAVLRGLRRRTIVWSHVLPNISATLVNIVALNIVYLIGGVIVIENVFAFPGIGQRLVSAVGQGDVPVVQDLVMLLGAIFIGATMLADLLVIRLTPKTGNA